MEEVTIASTSWLWISLVGIRFETKLAGCQSWKIPGNILSTQSYLQAGKKKKKVFSKVSGISEVDEDQS